MPGPPSSPIIPPHGPPQSAHLLGRLRFELLGVEDVDFEVPEGFPEVAVDLLVRLGQLQELGVHRGDELRGVGGGGSGPCPLPKTPLVELVLGFLLRGGVPKRLPPRFRAALR